MATTRACLQIAMSSVALVSLLEPRVAAVVVSVSLPEAGLVVVEQRDARHELGALPEIQVWDEQSSGPAVIGREWLALELPRDPRLSPGHVGESQVRRVARVRPRED